MWVFLSRSRAFACKPAASLGPVVPLAELMDGRTATVEASPPATIPLRLPVALNMPVEAVRIQRPAGMPLPGPGFLTSIQAPAMTIARLAGAICLPGGVMLAAPGVVLEETFSAPWERDHHHHMLRASDGTYTLKQDAADPAFLPGRYICLDYQHYLHYGHFVVDVLSKVWAYAYLTAYAGIDDVKVLVCGAPAAFASGLLDLCGIPDDRLVPLDRPVTAEHLFVPTKSFQIQEYTSHAAVATWRGVSNAERGEGGPKLVYVSRSRVGSRRMVNEAEVEALLRSKGFAVVHPQELSTRQQVGLFAGAELVVGASGSNMFNLAFQRRLRAALILCSPTLVHHTDVFMNVGHRCELAYFIGDRAADAPGFNPADVHAPWRIDLNAFAPALDRWLAEASPT